MPRSNCAGGTTSPRAPPGPARRVDWPAPPDPPVAERPSDERDPRPPSSGEQPALAPLVAQVIDRWESDGALALDDVCAEHPGLAAALRERVDRLRRAGLLGDPPPDAALPARLGNFRILSLLGRGGMGVVYLAEQEDLGRRVALKLVRPE